MNGTICSVTVRHSLIPTTSTLCDLFSSTQLTANVQTVAGVISLINDYLLSHVGRGLGFINRMLYDPAINDELTGVINDVTSGDTNRGCGTPGFQANIGWDPVRAACIFAKSFSTNFVLYTRSRVQGR